MAVMRPQHPPLPSRSRERGRQRGTPAPLREGVGGRGPARYITPVKTFLAILVALLMFATLGVLFAGLFGLVRGGGDPARSNQLMRWRVILQGAALLLFILLMTLLKS